jgi:hypothetical protein
MPAPTSQAQARLFGAIAGGQKKLKGFPASEARARLRGVHVAGLPKRKHRGSLRKALGY